MRPRAATVRSLSLTSELYQWLPEICHNSPSLLELKVGPIAPASLNQDGSIWPPEPRDIVDFELFRPVQIERRLEEFDDDDDADDADDEDQEGDEGYRDEEEDNEAVVMIPYELDIKPIAERLHQLRSLHVGPGFELTSQPHAPPVLDQLTHLERLTLSPQIRLDAHLCDKSRDEWNLRILAQSSLKLRVLDLRGCYLKILSLGWLRTEKLESLHLYYQAPAASVLFNLARNLKYLTLAHVNPRTRTWRCEGPRDPTEELNACLLALSQLNPCPLLQLDLRSSACLLQPLKTLLERCPRLEYLELTNCGRLPEPLRVRCVDRRQVEELLARCE